jgi:hypothetical protein
MTANQLADEAMEHYKAEAPRGFNVNWMQEVAIMLRQQQAEIEALKKELALQRLSDIGQAIENEPVAHRFKWEEKMSWQYGDGYDATGAPNDPDYFAYEPLYTHPNEDRDSALYATGYWKGIEYKKMRELTDGEILNIYLEQTNGNKDLDMLEFARFILKKASEK